MRTALANWLPEVPEVPAAHLTRLGRRLVRPRARAPRQLATRVHLVRRAETPPHPRLLATPFGLRPEPDDDIDVLSAKYSTHYEHAWQAFDDARPVLTELTRLGYVTAVLTNGATAQQNAKIDRIGLRDQPQCSNDFRRNRSWPLLAEPVLTPRSGKVNCSYTAM